MTFSRLFITTIAGSLLACAVAHAAVPAAPAESAASSLEALLASVGNVSEGW